MNIITDLHEAAAGLRVLATINGLELDIQREQMRARADRLDQYADALTTSDRPGTEGK